MTYYPTLREDIARAKEILAKGKAEPFMLGEDLQLPEGGAIYGADLFAAYKLLESFVDVIETMDVKVCELALRARRHGEELAAQHERCTSVLRGRRCVLVAHHDASMNATPHDYRPSITCPQCQMTSYHPKDISERYCGHCREFHDQMTAIGECVCRSRHCGHVASQHANGVCSICDKGICWC